MTVSGRTVGECYRGRGHHRRERHPAVRPAAEGARRLPGADRQHLPLGGDEDERDQRRVPRPLPVEPRASERLRGPRGGVRRAGGLPPPDRRPGARASTRTRILFMRGAGPKGYPGAAEVVNMRAPDYLLKQGVTSLVCIGDGRQSGTSGSPSILNASPEAASDGGAGADRDRRPGAARPQRRAGSTSWSATTSWRGAARRSRRRAATATRSTRRRGRRSSAASSASSRPARCWSRRSSTSGSRRPRGCRATTIEPAQPGFLWARRAPRRRNSHQESQGEQDRLEGEDGDEGDDTLEEVRE